MKNLLFYIIVILFFIGCRKFIEIDPPMNKLVTGNVFSNNETANNAILNIYAQMNSAGNTGQINSYFMALYTGMYGDELLNYSGASGYQLLYSNSLQPKAAVTNIVWSQAYNYIYQANAVYEGCSTSLRLSNDVKKQLMAESRFIRAFWHFYLVNFYGDIPYIISTDYTSNAVSSRLPTAEVYRQIIEDLQYSLANLNENYVSSNAVTPTFERLRPNKYAAAGLLARVHLFSSDYPSAEKYATDVLNNSTDYAILPLDQVFLKNSKEAIWQLPNPAITISFNTYDGRYFILTTKPTATSVEPSSLNPMLVNSFSGTDLRKTNWIGTFTDRTVLPNVNYYFPNKYKVKTGSNITEYTMIIRLAELYLIRAEARANQDNLTGAINDLDVLRGRAGLDLVKNTNPNISKTELLSLIMEERQHELFTEWGHRWMDIKRTGKADTIMSALAPLKGGTWSSDFLLWPIPFNDTQNSPNLPQNKGYNE